MMMESAMRPVIPLIGLLVVNCFGQSVVSSNTNTVVNECVDTGIKDLITSLKAKYQKLDAFTSVLATSRLLYENLDNPDLPAVLKEYCVVYQQKRQAIDRCPNDLAKDLAIYGFSLADDVCGKRMDDYAKNLPCIDSLTDVSAEACHSSCSKLEEASMAFVGQLLNGTTTAAGAARQLLASADNKAGDCKYLKCEAECRQEPINKKCPTATGFELNALSAVFSGERLQYGKKQEPFPQDCRALIMIPSADTPVSGATPGVNGSSGGGASAIASGMTGAADTGVAIGASGASGAAGGVTVVPSASSGSGLVASAAAASNGSMSSMSAAGGAVASAAVSAAPLASGNSSGVASAVSASGSNASALVTGGSAAAAASGVTVKPAAGAISANSSGSGSAASVSVSSNGTAVVASVTGGNGTAGAAVVVSNGTATTKAPSGAAAPPSSGSSSASGSAPAPAAPAAAPSTQKSGASAPRRAESVAYRAAAVAAAGLVAAAMIL